MAAKRPTGPLPMGNARPGFQLRRQPFPGAGERTPQSEVTGGTPAGVLPTAFGATGTKPFLPGRTSVKRSFQKLTDRRASPFFNAIPTGIEVGPQQPFAPQITDVETPAADALAANPFADDGGGNGNVRRRRNKRGLSRREKKRLINMRKKAAGGRLVAGTPARPNG